MRGEQFIVGPLIVMIEQHNFKILRKLFAKPKLKISYITEFAIKDIPLKI